MMPRLFSFLTAACLIGVPQLRAQSPECADTFALRDGDRVVFVGDGWVEREQRDGFIELALTTACPEFDLTFRNVGWSGDTVHGEARDHVTNPPTSYEHLLEQITAPRPTVLLLGYGGNLAFEGRDALPAFRAGLDTLLTDLGDTEARCVLIAPVPHDAHTSLSPNAAAFNENLALARDALAEAAQQRSCRFVDLYAGLLDAFRANDPLTEDGIYLNAAGYRAAARIIAEALGAPPPMDRLSLDFSAPNREAAIETFRRTDDAWHFALLPDALPHTEGPAHEVKIDGLPRGTFTLWDGSQQVATASARQWSDGRQFDPRPREVARREALRRAIVEKNRLYFRRFRPQNETYLVGFRRYEQGQNAPELEQLDPLIGALENEIGRLRIAPSIPLTLRKE
jgi:lysophospholipase L1-like esterase